MKRSNPILPKYPSKFLRWFCREEYLEEIEGDLCELFEKRYEASPRKTKRRFSWDVIRTFRPVNIKKPKTNSSTMNAIQNYIRIYFRRFKKETVHYYGQCNGSFLWCFTPPRIKTSGIRTLVVLPMIVEEEESDFMQSLPLASECWTASMSSGRASISRSQKFLLINTDQEIPSEK